MNKAGALEEREGYDDGDPRECKAKIEFFEEDIASPCFRR
jgi:hypothetical protein